MTTPAETIVDSLRRNPEQWYQSFYQLIHKPTNTVIWIANGWTFVDFSSSSSVSYGLGLFDKWKIWKAFRKWQADSIVAKFSETTSPALSASCGSAAEQLGAGEVGKGPKS